MFGVPLNRVMIAVAVAFGLFAMLRYVVTRHPKVEIDPEGASGRIAPNRALLAVISLIGTALAGSALFSFVIGHGGTLVLLVGIAALFMTAMMITAFFPVFDITWDEDGIEGPTLLLPPPYGPQRKRIYWEDIEKADNVQGRHWFLEDREGNRIVWSFIYYGYPILMARVEEECPWLFEEIPESKAKASAPVPHAAPEAAPLNRASRFRLGFATAKSV